MQVENLSAEEINVILQYREARHAQTHLNDDGPDNWRDPRMRASAHTPSSPTPPSSSPPNSRGSHSRGQTRRPRDNQIDPTLRSLTEQRLDAIDERLQSLEDQHARTDADADDEGDGAARKGSARRKKARKARSKTNKILSVSLNELSMEEIQTRHALFNDMKTEMRTLAGFENGEKLYSLGDEDVDEELAGAMVPDLREDATVNSMANSRLINRAATLVYNHYLTEEGKKTLPFPNILFLKNDLIEFGKSILRTFKETYKRENNEDAKEKYEKRCRQNRRRQRQSDKCKERLEAAAIYKRKNGGADPSLFLLTDFMTELASELETENELERIGNKSKVHHAANLTPEEKKDDVPVWEVVKIGFRSQEVDEIFEELDEIHRNELKKNKKRKGVRPPTKRAFIGRKNNAIPDERALARLFPFMIDGRWWDVHVRGTDVEAELRDMIRSRDPPGFGTRKDDPDGSDDEDYEDESD